MKWLEIHIVAPVGAQEAIAELCRQVGIEGARLDPDGVTVWIACTPELEAQRHALLSRVRRLPEWDLPPAIEVREHWRDDAEWAETWKQFFGVMHVGERIVVKPTWREYSARQGEVVLELDPGMAFGTGQHETTQMCLEYLEKLVQTGMTVVDVGTGSGILAIAAAKLGASRVWAGDNDPIAVLAAQRNVVRNGVEHIVSVQRAEGCDGAPPCDLLVANLTAGMVLELLADFARCLRAGGGGW